MPITDDEIDQLKAALAENKRNDSGVHRRRPIQDPTDHTRVMVPIAASSNKRAFHAYADGEPACGGTRETDYRPWPKVVALEWMDKCDFCYRDIDVRRGLDEDVEIRFGES